MFGHTFLRSDFLTGDPVRVTAEHGQQNKIANILKDIEGIGCRVQKPTGADGLGWRIIIDGNSDDTYPPGMGPPWSAILSCTGNGWIGTTYVTGYNNDPALPWIKVDVQYETASEELGPPANPCPENEVWFKKSATAGDFRVDRLG